MSKQDDVNRQTWSQEISRDVLRRRRGFLPGEREPFDYAIARVQGRPILELGCGAGRTIELTSPHTHDYRAIDYLPEMVTACRAAFPGVRVELGDARTLDNVPDHHFGMVTFAWNGIDAVSHRDRAAVLRAVHRVLLPDGVFFFSTLNLDGPDRRERPWHVVVKSATSSIVRALNVAKAVRHATNNVVNWLKLLPMVEHGSGYVVAPMPAHGYGILAHFTTLERQLDELAHAGFSPNAKIFASVTGAALEVGDDTSGIDYFHFVATPSAGAVTRLAGCSIDRRAQDSLPPGDTAQVVEITPKLDDRRCRHARTTSARRLL